MKPQLDPMIYNEQLGRFSRITFGLTLESSVTGDINISSNCCSCGMLLWWQRIDERVFLTGFVSQYKDFNIKMAIICSISPLKAIQPYTCKMTEPDQSQLSKTEYDRSLIVNFCQSD